MEQVLTLRNQAAEESRLVQWLSQLEKPSGWSQRDTFRLELALNEAVANVIEHAFPNGGEHEFQVHARRTSQTLAISVSDNGPAYDPLERPEKVLPTRLEDAEIGGLGIHLIRKYCDACHYQRADERNILTMEFGVAPAVNLVLLQSHRLLKDVPAPALEALAQKCRVVRLTKDEVLLTPGQENHTLYLLLSGQLRVCLDSRESSNGFPIPPGEILGEMSIIEHKPVMAWVLGDQPCELLAIPEEVFWTDFLPLPSVTRGLLQMLAARMRKTDTALLQEFERKLRYEILQRELQSAGKIQANILPSVQPLFPKHPQVETHALIQPAREVGGDFFDALVVNENCLAVAIGDVSGKGLPAALFMVKVITCLRLCLLRETDPSAVLPALNKLLCEGNDEFMFVTLAVALLDVRTGKLTYLNAGHNPPLRSIGGGPFSVWEPPAGPLLGVEPAAKFATKELVLHSGDTMLFYTDGVSEAENTKHELFTLERAAVAASQPAAQGTVIELVESLKKSLADFTGAAPQSDDITVLGLRYLGSKK